MVMAVVSSPCCSGGGHPFHVCRLHLKVQLPHQVWVRPVGELWAAGWSQSRLSGQKQCQNTTEQPSRTFAAKRDPTVVLQESTAGWLPEGPGAGVCPPATPGPGPAAPRRGVGLPRRPVPTSPSRSRP